MGSSYRIRPRAKLHIWLMIYGLLYSHLSIDCIYTTATITVEEVCDEEATEPDDSMEEFQLETYTDANEEFMMGPRAEPLIGPKEELGVERRVGRPAYSVPPPREEYRHFVKQIIHHNPQPTPPIIQRISLGSANVTQYKHQVPIEKPNIVLPTVRVYNGPFFYEGTTLVNLTAKVGATLSFDCRVGHPQDPAVSKVIWTKKEESRINLLTIGKSIHIKDHRMELLFCHPYNYKLRITFLTARDSGMYECQIASHPPAFRKVHVEILEPDIRIVDEMNQIVTDRYYRLGSALVLTCIAENIGFSDTEADKYIVLWKFGAQLLNDSSSLNASRETDSAYSILRIEPLDGSHAGNYSCIVASVVEKIISIHVLDGDRPAAVQSAGNIGSFAIALLFAIMISCVFSR